MPARVAGSGGESVGFAGQEVQITPPGLEGRLCLPRECCALVVFAHGSGSSRFSPRNNYVASAFEERGLGTLLFDLLRPDEETDRAKVFDIELLAERLLVTTGWLGSHEDTADLAIGYFGASTGAAAALAAAAEEECGVAAIVSRGGRPDLAGAALPMISVPTLLIVGGQDTQVLALNREALDQLRCEKALEIVPGAGHLFEEPGALDAVIELARDWFTRHLVKATTG